MAAKIIVTFIDDLADTIMGTVELTPEGLPPSFEQATTLYIGEADWNVVSADPKQSEDFIASGLLSLRLQKVQKIDPNSILFSLPTLADALPEDTLSSLPDPAFQLLEDDWRQFELISNAQKAIADLEIEKVLEIHANASEESGWSKIHVREDLQTPISSAIEYSSLKGIFERIDEKAIAFYGHAGLIKNGFAFSLSEGATLYGIQNKGVVNVIAIDTANGVFTNEEIDALVRFAKVNSLMIVDWCECILAGAESEEFREIL